MQGIMEWFQSSVACFRPFNSPAFRGCHPDFVKITRSPG